MHKKLNLYTHDGLFHADDVFAAALLSLIAEEINTTLAYKRAAPRPNKMPRNSAKE